MSGLPCGDDAKEKKNKMNMRKALPLLVIASMMLSMLPSAFFANAALGVPTIAAITAGATGLKGQTYKVTGGVVAAGTTIQIYWDDTTTAWDGVKGLMNSTTAKADGSYEVWFKVPEAKNGNHYVWAKAVSTNELQSTAAFVVNTKISLSASSGLPGDKITVSAYGFGASKAIQAFLLNGTQVVLPGWTPAWIYAAETLATGDASKTTFSGTVAQKPVQPGNFTVTVGAVVLADAGLTGALTGAGGSGTINYITGEYSLTYAAPPAVVAITAVYSYFKTNAAAGIQVYTSGTTNSVGSYTTQITIPSKYVKIAADYRIVAYDAVGNMKDAGAGVPNFSVGPVISAGTTSTTVGSVVTIQGRGFGVGKVIGLVNLPTIIRTGMVATTCAIKDMPVGGVVVDAQGRFRMDIIIAQGNEKNDDYTITVKTDDNANIATITDFEITALAEVSVTPSYGPQGSSIAVSGVHYAKVADTVITVDLVTTGGAFLINIGTVKTLSDGTISKTFSVPAWVDGTYKIAAYNLAQNIADTTGFRIGSMYINLSAASGPTGKAVTVTGSGFSAGKTWNATIGSKTLQSTTAVAGTGLINAVTYIPKMAPGTYTVTVWDIDADIKLTTTFAVTYSTQITLTPSTAANGFNVTIFGKGFKGVGGTGINFLLYNKTSTGATDRSWTMNVLQNYVIPLNTAPTVNGTGIVRGYWVIPAAAVLSKGTYYINATDAGDYLAQATFVIGDKHIVAAPRKSSFAIGETLSFTLEHTFGNIAPVLNGDLRIYNPSGVLVFDGDPLGTWIKTGEWYVSPYSGQTAGGNPMTIRDDSPTGTWTWKWRDAASDVIKEGTFTVTASTASETDTKIAAVAAQVTALANSVSQLSTTVGNVATTANTASTAASAASTAASAAKTSADAATAAATAAGTKADAATAAANSAKTAADSAAAAANGLTTLVYAAIGASLVAALAAIVALMQISRKIA